MFKKVLFTGKNNLINISFGKPNDFVSGTPKCFDNAYDGFAKLSVIDIYGMFFKNGDTSQKPYVYFRHIDVQNNEYRFGNVVELGDDYLSFQKGVLHPDEIADRETEMIPYQQNESGYFFGTSSKYSRGSFEADGFKMNEANFFKVSTHKWPFTVYDHQSLYDNSSIILQPSTFVGTLDGEPVIGLGSYDRFCISNVVRNFESINMEYIAFSGMGIREDGRKEVVLISVAFDGKVVIYYLLDGQLPIITNEVVIETEWHKLPYVDDDTCTFKDAIFYFLDKEIHFNGKWATKGFTKTPRVDKHGQSQVFGTWYEGKNPYKHRLYYTISESMGVYSNRLKEMGFDVAD